MAQVYTMSLIYPHGWLCESGKPTSSAPFTFYVHNLLEIGFVALLATNTWTSGELLGYR